MRARAIIAITIILIGFLTLIPICPFEKISKMFQLKLSSVRSPAETGVNVFSSSESTLASSESPQDSTNSNTKTNETNLSIIQDSFQLPIPSVILKPFGGIGNQLFMYAACYSIAKRLNTTLFIQIPSQSSVSVSAISLSLKNNGSNKQLRKFTANSREYALDYFNLNNTMVKYLPSSLQLHNIPQQESIFTFNELDILKNNSFDLPNNKILIANDYWESELFFKSYKEEILTQFRQLNIDKAKIQDLIHEITFPGTVSIGVHIRRGDFVRFGQNNRSLPLSYQINAMKLIQTLLVLKNSSNSSIKYFIFSDNINYVRRQFQNLNIESVLQQHNNNNNNNIVSKISIIYVSNPTITNSLQEFYLLTKCSHLIISNSTFSWWAAYLSVVNDKNLKKIIIAPFPKHRQRIFQFYFNNEKRKWKKWLSWKYSYPVDWLTINPYESFEDLL